MKLQIFQNWFKKSAQIEGDSEAGAGCPLRSCSASEFTYSSRQATNCAGCGRYRHTPLRRDEMGGYVCLTCIDRELDRLQEQNDESSHRLADKPNTVE